MQVRTGRGETYLQVGPNANPKSLPEIRRATAELWQRCSMQMNGICETNRIAYLHFLQPNLHLPGSKPIGQAERDALKLDMVDYSEPVEQGYPLLIAAGHRLRNSGVRFHDLTMLFLKTSRPIYVDQCCHYNQRGNDLLAREVATAILASGND